MPVEKQAVLWGRHKTPSQWLPPGRETGTGENTYAFAYGQPGHLRGVRGEDTVTVVTFREGRRGGRGTSERGPDFSWGTLGGGSV